MPLGLDHRKNPGRNTWHPNCTGCPFLATLATGRLGDVLSSDASSEAALGKKPQQLGHFRVFRVSFLAAESKDVDLTCRSCSAQEPLQGLPCCCRHWYFGACRPASDSCDFLHSHGQNSQQMDDFRIEGDGHSPNIPLVRNP